MEEQTGRHPLFFFIFNFFTATLTHILRYNAFAGAASFFISAVHAGQRVADPFDSDTIPHDCFLTPAASSPPKKSIHGNTSECRNLLSGG